MTDTGDPNPARADDLDDAVVAPLAAAARAGRAPALRGGRRSACLAPVPRHPANRSQGRAREGRRCRDRLRHRLPRRDRNAAVDLPRAGGRERRSEPGMLAYFKRVQPKNGRLFTGGLAWIDRKGNVRVSTNGRQARPDRRQRLRPRLLQLGHAHRTALRQRRSDLAHDPQTGHRDRAPDPGREGRGHGRARGNRPDQAGREQPEGDRPRLQRPRHPRPREPAGALRLRAPAQPRRARPLREGDRPACSPTCRGSTARRGTSSPSRDPRLRNGP